MQAWNFEEVQAVICASKAVAMVLAGHDHVGRSPECQLHKFTVWSMPKMVVGSSNHVQLCTGLILFLMVISHGYFCKILSCLLRNYVFSSPPKARLINIRPLHHSVAHPFQPCPWTLAALYPTAISRCCDSNSAQALQGVHCV